MPSGLIENHHHLLIVCNRVREAVEKGLHRHRRYLGDSATGSRYFFPYSPLRGCAEADFVVAAPFDGIAVGINQSGSAASIEALGRHPRLERRSNSGSGDEAVAPAG